MSDKIGRNILKSFKHEDHTEEKLEVEGRSFTDRFIFKWLKRVKKNV